MRAAALERITTKMVTHVPRDTPMFTMFTMADVHDKMNSQRVYFKRAN